MSHSGTKLGLKKKRERAFKNLKAMAIKKQILWTLCMRIKIKSIRGQKKMTLWISREPTKSSKILLGSPRWTT
ncbi:hypothetical protein BFW01_g4160 [Lasiodiplodia theobromae]|nr:hypothetical protein BFW01_g4160 [Lasiodiplodia theobromae]